MRPSTGAANAKELYFDKLDSGYTVGTAGTKATGRSRTIHLFHGSEVAHWPNARDHFAGVMQAVPRLLTGRVEIGRRTDADPAST